MTNFEKVQEFHRAIREPTGDMKTLRIRLILEEVDELIEAVIKDDRENMLKEACDLLYVVYGLCDVLQLPADKGFERVHDSNMSKVTPPIYREDGKLLKGPMYVEPYLGDLV